MALVAKGNASGWFVGFTFYDVAGRTTRVQYETSATTEAEAQVIADGLFAEFALLSTAQIIGTSIRKDLVETNPTFITGSDNTERAKVTVLLTGGTKKAVLSIPSPAASLMAGSEGPNRNIVNVENTNLLDLIAWFGATGPGNGALISDGETIDEPVKGQRVTISTAGN